MARSNPPIATTEYDLRAVYVVFHGYIFSCIRALLTNLYAKISSRHVVYLE